MAEAILAFGAVLGGGEDAGGGSSRNGAAEDRRQIEQAVAGFIAAYNAGDAERIMSAYAPDLIKLRQGSAPETRRETAERLERVFREYRGQLTVVNDEIVVSGDLAYARGTLSLTLTPRVGGAAHVVRRRFLEIWRKRAGRWFVARTMDNAPPQGG